MLEFLQQFLRIFPELRSAPLFLAGESYAGKYIPALGIQIHRYNTKALQSNTENTASQEEDKHLINLRVCIIFDSTSYSQSMHIARGFKWHVHASNIFQNQ